MSDNNYTQGASPIIFFISKKKVWKWSFFFFEAENENPMFQNSKEYLKFQLVQKTKSRRPKKIENQIFIWEIGDIY